MHDEDPRDYLIGVPLQVALAQFHQSKAKGDFSHTHLYLNRSSGGTVLATKHDQQPTQQELQAFQLTHFASLTSYDLPTVNLLLSNDTAMATLIDHILHEYAEPKPPLFHLTAIKAATTAFESAAARIEQLEDLSKVKEGNMPLNGSLKKVLNYMAIQFNQGQYEFLNIIFNMQSHEYELYTPAELERLQNTGRFGDRRLVLSCTVHELRKLITTDQLRLDIPNAEEPNPQTRTNRELDARESPAAVADSNESQTRRPDNDGPITGPQSHTVESA